MSRYFLLFVVVFVVAVNGHDQRFGPESFGPERGGFGGGFGGYPGAYPGGFPGGFPGFPGSFPRCPPCAAGTYLPAGATTCTCVACTTAPATCVAPKTWDTTTCRCGCAQPATPCTIYQILDPNTCVCVCRFQFCPWTGAAINPTTCQC